MAHMAKGAFALGIFALLVAFFIPTVIGGVVDDRSHTISLQNQSSETLIDDTIETQVKAIKESPDPSTVNISVTDLDQLSTNETQVNVSESGSVTLEGDTITFDVDRLDDGPAAVYTVTHPSTYGWDPAAATVASQLDILLAGLGFVLIIGSILMAIP